MFRIFLLLNILLLLISCENNMDDVQRVSFNPKSPDEVIVDFHMVYSDSGFARVALRAGFAETYRSPEHITHLRDSLRVNFYGKNGEMISTLTAKYGKINHSKNQLMVKDSVRLYNYQKKQTLKTEVLYWQQKDSMIFTPKRVYIFSPKGKFMGEGLKTKQDFSRYEILKPQGNVVIEKEEEL
ncbi:MAG: export transporter periplasmic protein LptC [Bacteroidota bacterium]|jgi:LPS export ABC transporter protein LptC